MVRNRSRRATRPAFAALALLAATPVVSAQVPFRRVEIEPNAGDVKLVGDIDLDGTVDIVLGGMPAEGLNWYHYPTWTRTRIAVPATEFTTDGAIGDVDGDGDLDLVVPDGSSGDNLLWFENPTIGAGGTRGDPFDPRQWTPRAIGTVGSWCKDVEIADYDGDGRLDVAARRRDQAMVFFREPGGGWTRMDLQVAALGNEGLAQGDVDRDGADDLVVRGAWLRNPRGGSARAPGAWQEHAVDTTGLVDATFKALVTDLDSDGRSDLVFSSSERTADVVWFRHSGDPTGTWTPTSVVANVDRAHTLQAADMDGDGDVDLVVGQMHTASEPDIKIHFNLDGRGTSWQTQLVDDSYGIHNGVVADVGADGDLEVVGSNWTGHPPLQFWENLTPQTGMRLRLDELRSPGAHEFDVSNAPPGAEVWLCASLAGTTTPYTVTGLGALFELRDPVLIGQATAGPNGVAPFGLPVPPGVTGVRVWLQAIATGASSDVAQRDIR